MEKQIDEMEKVIKSSLDGLGYGNFNFTAEEIGEMFAKALYKAGYRKRREGEWILIQDGKGVCSTCHRQDAIDGHAHFCRYCGAHMKGGAE